MSRSSARRPAASPGVAQRPSVGTAPAVTPAAAAWLRAGGIRPTAGPRRGCRPFRQSSDALPDGGAGGRRCGRRPQPFLRVQHCPLPAHPWLVLGNRTPGPLYKRGASATPFSDAVCGTRAVQAVTGAARAAQPGIGRSHSYRKAPPCAHTPFSRTDNTVRAFRNVVRCGTNLRNAERCGTALRHAQRCGTTLRHAQRCDTALRGQQKKPRRFDLRGFEPQMRL